MITDAVSSQVWPGEANVHVSLVNWTKEPRDAPPPYLLDGLEVPGISASLRPQLTPGGGARQLPENAGRVFEGAKPGDRGFIIEEDEARALLKRGEALYSRVVRPYLVGKDIATAPGARPSRWIIDFGQMALEDAERFPAAMAIVRERVKPRRERNRRKIRRENWWRFSEVAPAARAAIRSIDRYIAIGITGKRLLMTWVDPLVCPSTLSTWPPSTTTTPWGFFTPRFTSAGRGSSRAP